MRAKGRGERTCLFSAVSVLCPFFVCLYALFEQGLKRCVFLAFRSLFAISIERILWFKCMKCMRKKGRQWLGAPYVYVCVCIVHNDGNLCTD